MKVLNDLFDYNLKIYQSNENFKFSLDSILLAEFIKLKPNTKIIDLGTGLAPIPLILTTKYSNKIYGIELQPEITYLAQQNVIINNLANQIDIKQADLMNLEHHFPRQSFEVVCCNPPYFKGKGSLVSQNKSLAICKHEITFSLSGLIKTVNYLLKEKGCLYLSYRIERLQELFLELARYDLRVKELVLIQTHKPNFNLILLKAVKQGNFGLKSRIIDISQLKSYQNLF